MTYNRRDYAEIGKIPVCTIIGYKNGIIYYKYFPQQPSYDDDSY